MKESRSVRAGGSPRALRSARSFPRRILDGDTVAHRITIAAASSIVLITALIAYELYKNSALSRQKFGWRFLVSQTWDPVAEQFGALPFIYGTVVTSMKTLPMDSGSMSRSNRPRCRSAFGKA